MDHSEVKYLPKVDHTPAELDEASRLLLKAAALLEERGHCKSLRMDDQGRFCVLGAIDFSAGFHDPMNDGGDNHGLGDSVWWLAVGRLGAAIQGYQGASNWKAALWNNAEERTQDEVVAKLRAVALGL